MTRVPRYRYMFYVNFIVNSDPLVINQSFLSKLGTWQNGISFKIKTIDKPKVDLTTVELNQYNRKRYAYTKVEYQPFTVRLHDTVDNTQLNMWREYFTYYFGDSRTKTATDMSSSTVGGTFADSTGWGFRPLGEDISFFSRIELYSLFGKQYTRTTYLNPRITNIDWEQYDSSNSDPEEVTITFKYEAIEYNDPAPITDLDVTKFGFDVDGSAAVDPPGVVAPSIQSNNSSTNAYNASNQQSITTPLFYQPGLQAIAALATVFAASATGPVDNAPAAYANNMTGSSTAGGVLANTQTSINSALSGAILTDFG